MIQSSSSLNSSRFSTPKSYPRSARAETRNRTKEELKRVINSVERVRKWEQRWVLLKDSSIYIYKWVPVSGSTPTTKPLSAIQKTAALLSERPNSNENSNDTLNTPTNSQLGLNEESNTAFSEGFDSDSNQASNLLSSDLSRPAMSGNGGSTDFSALIREEEKDSNSDDKLDK
ncbi:BCL7-like protein C28H8.1 [Aphelenchoides bicaudatus]|nr:BCL7-like protein C28H8.1 [Aphelenchoides bicaudatus]KAI6170377.1 BCL7-like protein C28H8.1 [Aphelenchoides bicaudatus]